MDQRHTLDLEVSRSLVQSALLAVWQRDYPRAQIILDGLSACRKDLVPVTYVYTLLYQATGGVDKAIDLLRSTTQAQSGNDMAKALLGFMLQQDGRSGWRELLEKVLANAADAPAVELAEHLLRGDGCATPPPSDAAERFPPAFAFASASDMVRA